MTIYKITPQFINGSVLKHGAPYVYLCGTVRP